MQRFKNILCIINTGIKDNVVLDHAVKLATNNQARLAVIEVIDEIQPSTKLFERTLSLENLQERIVIEHEKKLKELTSTWASKIEIKDKVITGILFLEVIREVLRNDYDLVFKMSDSGGLLSRVFGSDDMHLLRKCPCPVWLIKHDSPKTYQQILAAVDVDNNYPDDQISTRNLLNHQILEMGLSLALSESAKLHIVHVWDAIGEGAMRVGFIQKTEDEVNRYVESIRQRQIHNMDSLIDEIAEKMGRDALEYLQPNKYLIKGFPRKSVPKVSKEINADLVVMGTVARTGLPGVFMGNTAESILNQLDCSVLAVKPPGFVTPVTLNE